MSPSFAEFNKVNGHYRDPIVSRNCMLRPCVVKGSDGLFLAQFHSSVRRTFWSSLRVFARAVLIATATPTFRNHVGRVISNSAEEKMGRIAAWSDIATVQNTHATRNLTISKFVRCSVRRPSVLAAADNSVATFCCAAHPNQATTPWDRNCVLFDDALNIAWRKWFGTGFHDTSAAVIEKVAGSPAAAGRRLQPFVPAISL